MKEQDKNKIKDKILTSLVQAENKDFSIQDIATKVEIDFDFAFYLCDELIASKLVYFRDTTTKSGRDKMISINPNGKYFMLHDGGFAAKQEKETKSKKDEDELDKLNRTKMKTEILRNRIFNAITIPSTIYALCDLIGKIVQPGFDFLEFLALLLGIR